MKTEWIFVAIFLLISLFLNCDAGRARINFIDLAVNIRNAPVVRWVHGWPIKCFGREGLYSAVSGKSIYPPADYSKFGGFNTYSRYPIDRAPVIYYSLRNAAFNFILVMLAAFGIYCCTKTLNDRGQLRLQFRLRSALLVVSVISVPLAFRHTVADAIWIVQTSVLFAGTLSMAAGIFICIVGAFLFGSSIYLRNIAG